MTHFKPTLFHTVCLPYSPMQGVIDKYWDIEPFFKTKTETPKNLYSCKHSEQTSTCFY